MIFGLASDYFGDSLASINYCLHLSVVGGSPVKLHCRADQQSTFEEILSVINSPGKVILTAEEPTKMLSSMAVWHLPFWPTYRQWDFHEKHSSIVVQFDGRSAPNKLATAAEEQEIMNQIKDRFPGKRIVRIGKELGLRASIEVACDSVFFVGICSGMSHLMHSVGCPVFLLEFGLPLAFCHSGKAYWRCDGVGGFINQLGWFRKGLEGIKHPDIAI